MDPLFIWRLAEATGLKFSTLVDLYEQGWEVIRQPPPYNHLYAVVKTSGEK